ncbi:protoporphyrinogen oxidase [Salipiger sp. P9]|uniref:flavodoxin domain-containing protein n=1 Tax=Salipiger pentaromativorans TaxID=2943193 RepID=UPI0021575503|nr:flavodoxin domain-containing protein [Salipiger pentaromativorans]MCR8546602.1 protoporphyrinogen oxidase [Salipiger pentaromativorans]
MRILVAYATTEGQTRKICRFVSDRLAGNGHTVELLNVADAEGLDAARFDAAVLAGSVHVGKLQPALIAFARAQAGALAERPTLFLQVSLAAAGQAPEDWEELRAIARESFDEAGWTPGRIEHVAGAFRFSEYDFFRTWAMRWIAAQQGQKVDPKSDREYTDWGALGAAVDDWARSAAEQR